MCMICIELAKGKMNIGDARIALIEMAPMLGKEHVDIVEKLIDTVDKSKSSGGNSGESGTSLDTDEDVYDYLYALRGYID